MVSKESLAQPAHQSTPDYVWRGYGFFELHAEDILADYQDAGRWLVPSGSESGKTYEVRVSPMRPARDRCECQGFTRHGHCSHHVAAQRVARRSAVCDACSERRWWSDLREVQEDDGLLAWFAGDVLCEGCIRAGHWC